MRFNPFAFLDPRDVDEAREARRREYLKQVRERPPPTLHAAAHTRLSCVRR